VKKKLTTLVTTIFMSSILCVPENVKSNHSAFRFLKTSLILPSKR